MPVTVSSKNIRSNYGKIIMAFLLGCIIVLVSLGINKTTFRQVLNTVNQLSQPDPKLILVNNIFRDVIELDQLQRTQAVQTTPKPYNPFLKESRTLQLMLDTLKNISGQNPAQIKRIDSMKRILYERDKLFISYLYLRNNLSSNDSLAAQVKELSHKMAGTLLSLDSNLVTTEKKVTTTTTEHADTTGLSELSKQSFWDKIFGRKKNQNVKQIEKLVKEDLNVRLDTSALSREDSIIQLLSKTISSEQSGRLKRRTILTNRQLQLSKASNVLVNQLLSILKDIETEATQQSHHKNSVATQIVDRDIEIMDIILVLFICATALLVYLVFADVARSNRYKRELIIARDEAEQLGQVKQRFLANMSHELRTPLQSIIGVSEQLRMKSDTPNNETEILYHSSQHLLQIINEVLDYSRIISGRFYFENKPFNMRQLVDEIKGTIQIQATKKGLNFVSKDNLDEQQYYTGDPFRLKQILYNLLGNAVKFTDHGIVALYTNYQDFSDHATYSFTIKDTGIGIEEHNIEKIFSEFETVSASSNIKGTGLGLNIVKALVENQGGSIDASSLLGHGSEFKVTLTFPKTQASLLRDHNGRPQPLSFSGKVWVVDDDAFILQLCVSIFEKYNISYECFGSAEQALQAEPDEEVTLFLLDIRLPGMNGIELCKKLKAKEKNTGVRFIALTAQVMSDEKDSILKNGFDDLLAKPFLERDLLSVIEKNNDNTTKGESIDLSAIYQMAGNDADLVNDTLRSFITETEKDIKELKDCIEQEQFIAAANILHRLASRCGQVGAHDLLLQLRKKETALRADSDLKLNDLKKEMTLLYFKITNLLYQIKTTNPDNL